MIISSLSKLLLPLLLLAAAAPAVADVKAAPNCVLTSIDQLQTIKLQEYQDKVVYLDFWASWCGPCLESFPFMRQLHSDLQAKGLEVVAVNLDEDLADAQAFLDEHPANFRVVIDGEQQCAKQFELKAMPSSYLIDRNGNIRATHLGFRAGEAMEFRQTVEAVLREGLR